MSPSSSSKAEITTVVFDLGGVLIDWNQRYLYRKLFKNADQDPSQMESFIANVVSHEWNTSLDAGHSFADGVRELTTKFPEHADLIKAYHTRWPEMLGEAIHGTVEILKELRPNYRLLALSNWSAETFPFARERFDFLKWFEAILVSGEEKMVKPDPKFYQLLETRHLVQPNAAVFIDDVQKNTDAALALGFNAIRFESPSKLRESLRALGVRFA